MSNPTWFDSWGSNCKVYEKNRQLCDVGVEYLPPYLPPDHVLGYTDDALQAKMACCVCGGGDWVEYSFLPTRVSEKDCLEQCLNMETCTSVMHAPVNDSSHHIAGQCWISTKTNPNQTEPDDDLWLHPSLAYDQLWTMESVVHRAPQVVQEFCDDSTFSLPNSTSDARFIWKDRYNRTCEDYRRLGFCDSSTPNAGITFTFPPVRMVQRYQAPLPNGTLVWKDNITYTKERTGFFPFYGTSWDFLNVTGEGGPSFEAAAQSMMTDNGLLDFGPASEACCDCGKVADPLGFNTFVRRPGNVSLSLSNVSDLVCSPELHNALLTSEAPCSELMVATPDEAGTPRCCIRPNVSVALVLETCDDNECKDQGLPMEIIDYNINSTNGWVIVDGLALLDSKAAGTKGQTVRLVSTRATFGAASVDGAVAMMGAILRPVVEGRIFHVTIKKRGAGYTTDPYLLLWPTVRPEHHNTSMWKADDETTHSFFTHARMGFSIGFPGDEEGTFDGRNMEYMCENAQGRLRDALAIDPSDQAACQSSPYGEGYGACIAMTRASDAQVAASTTSVDFSNATDLPTAGASAVVAFRIDEIQFVAIANYMNASVLDFEGGSPLGPFSSPTWSQSWDSARRARSQLFRLVAHSDGSLEASLVQEFETETANHVSYSKVGGLHMLCFAQEQANVSQLYALPLDAEASTLFTDEGAKFELIQRIPTRGARAIHPFKASPSYGGEDLFLVAQTEEAQQCALEDELSNEPLCGAQSSGIARDGSVFLGRAEDLTLEQGHSMMLRWNGSRAQGTNIMETLPSDVAGGQAFLSHKATDFVPFRSRDGTDHAMLLNFEESEICRDDPSFGCEAFRPDESGQEQCADYVRSMSHLYLSLDRGMPGSFEVADSRGCSRRRLTAACVGGRSCHQAVSDVSI